MTGPVSGKDSSSAEEGKGKRRKTIDHLEEEEMRVVSKVQEDGTEDKHVDDIGGDLKKSKWFDKDQKQERRPKKKKIA